MKVYAGIYKTGQGRIVRIKGTDHNTNYPWTDEFDEESYTDEGQIYDDCTNPGDLVERLELDSQDGIFIKFEDMLIPEGWEFSHYGIPKYGEYCMDYQGNMVKTLHVVWTVPDFIFKKVVVRKYWAVLDDGNSIITHFECEEDAEDRKEIEQAIKDLV